MQRVKAVGLAEHEGAERRTRSRRSATERQEPMNQLSTLLLVAGVVAIVLATRTDMVRGPFREFQQCRRYKKWAEQHLKLARTPSCSRDALGGRPTTESQATVRALTTAT